MRNGRLAGDVALITGGASGVGRAVAERYLAEGASVTIVGIDPAQNQQAESDLRVGDRLLALTGDVRNPDDMTAAVAATIEAFGKLDIVVPNAGIWDYNRSVTRLSGTELAAAFDEVMAINVKGYLLTVNAAWRELVATRGCVIMTLSNASFYSAGGGPVYTASKFAARGLVLQLAYELAPKVRVNGVAVGGMRTDLRGPASLALDERRISDSFDRNGTGSNPAIPLHDASTDPEAFVAAYVLLGAREESQNITGSIINVDGGIAARGFRSAAGGDDL